MSGAAFRQEIIQLLGISEDTVMNAEQENASYKEAFKLYEKKAYRKSAHLFSTLVLTSPFSLPYWKGLASAKLMARDYEASLHAWSLVALLNKEDPYPHFYAAKCLMAMGEKKEAEKALQAALSLNKDPDLETPMQRLKETLHALN